MNNNNNKNLFPMKSKPTVTIKKNKLIIDKDSDYPTKKTNEFLSRYPKGTLPFFDQFSSSNPLQDIEFDPTLTEQQFEDYQLKILRLHICEIHRYIDSISFYDRNHRRTIEDLEKEIKEKYYSAKPEDLEKIKEYENSEELEVQSRDNSPSYYYDPPDPE